MEGKSIILKNGELKDKLNLSADELADVNGGYADGKNEVAERGVRGKVVDRILYADSDKEKKNKGNKEPIDDLA